MNEMISLFIIILLSLVTNGRAEPTAQTHTDLDKACGDIKDDAQVDKKFDYDDKEGQVHCFVALKDNETFRDAPREGHYVFKPAAINVHCKAAYNDAKMPQLKNKEITKQFYEFIKKHYPHALVPLGLRIVSITEVAATKTNDIFNVTMKWDTDGEKEIVMGKEIYGGPTVWGTAAFVDQGSVPTFSMKHDQWHARPQMEKDQFPPLVVCHFQRAKQTPTLTTPNANEPPAGNGTVAKPNKSGIFKAGWMTVLMAMVEVIHGTIEPKDESVESE